MEKIITLKEALCGYDFLMNHLDGRVLNVKATPGEITDNEQVKVIENEGMPLLGTAGFQKGRLFIVFKLKLPKKNQLNSSDIAQLKTILPGPTSPKLEGDEVEVAPAPVNIEEFGANDDYEEEEEEDRSGVRQVQCQNM